ncbi:transcriptional regulator PerR [Thermotalea metallivorans]|uniref:Transcriptional regulator PerR n=1 Tax=Thermotalea metallivorans TaxID=520762 RepID=A0A140LEC3_9FIRM|nr:Fur family transcriptional regulator [Thermotalea metallivorans]KXG78898.1 Transcriptional regulator PerR [Thermotalea metallivorans]
MKDFAKILRDHGMKVTPQRIAIYDILIHTTEHPSAEVIYKKLAPIYPTMSLATVYKSLDAFKKAGLVQELNVGECSFRYDAKTNSHPHIICTSCHRVDDIQEDIFSDLFQKVNAFTNYSVHKQQLYFYGLCPQCK